MGMKLNTLVAQCLLAGSLAGPALAAERTPTQAEDILLMAPVQRLVDAINHGQTSFPDGIFAPGAAMQDDFAPYHWSGAQAAQGWYGGLLGTNAADHAAFLALHGVISAGKPSFARITDDAAYFVVPGVFLFDLAPGKRIRQTATWVFSETHGPTGWLISGHAWAITGETDAGK